MAADRREYMRSYAKEYASEGFQAVAYAKWYEVNRLNLSAKRKEKRRLAKIVK